jgi:spore coat protein D
MYCRPNNVMPAVVHPTKCCVNHTFSTTVVPHIHPTHTTNVHHNMIQHKHFFPQTQSNVNQVSNQQFVCPPGAAPGFGGPGFGPGPGPGFGGPGFGPGPGPGFGGPGFGPGPGFGGPGPGPMWGR